MTWAADRWLESADWITPAISSPGAQRAAERPATPDAHFFTESAIRGTKNRSITPDYADRQTLKSGGWHQNRGTDAAMALASGPEDVLREFHLDKPKPVFTD